MADWVCFVIKISPFAEQTRKSGEENMKRTVEGRIHVVITARNEERDR